MALADWVEIYRDYSTEDLRELRRELRAEAETSYSAQGLGGKSQQTALSEVRDKLQAATRVLRERTEGASSDDYSGRADFSGLGGIS